MISKIMVFVGGHLLPLRKDAYFRKNYSSGLLKNLMLILLLIFVGGGGCIRTAMCTRMPLHERTRARQERKVSSAISGVDRN